MTRSVEQVTVSVVIPAYNAAWCVAHAVDSVLAQHFRDYELIVVNDGSSDNTAEVLSAYDDKLRVVDKPNGGLSSARNAGIGAARGRYVAFLDADDRWLPGKLDKQVALMTARPELVFCSTAALLEDPDGMPLGEWRCGSNSMSALKGIFSANAYVAGSGSAVLVQMDALEKVGGFDERLRSLEDIDMWMRLSAIGDYACIEEPMAIVLKRPGSMSGDLDVMRHAAITVMRRNRKLLPHQERGSYWRHAYAGMLSDYAKWAWRSGRRGQALRDVFTALMIAPLSRGRLMLCLLLSMFLDRKV
jgi:glycosyltransferase involved in cell wall biosynthesis